MTNRFLVSIGIVIFGANLARAQSRVASGTHAATAPNGTWELLARDRYRMTLVIEEGGKGRIISKDEGGAQTVVDRATWDAGAKLLKFRRIGPGWWQWYRLSQRGTQVTGTFAHSGTSAAEPRLADFIYKVTGAEVGTAGGGAQASPAAKTKSVALPASKKRIGGLLGHVVGVTPDLPGAVSLPKLKQKYQGQRHEGLALGELVAIAKLIAAYEQAMAKGEAPAGEKAPTELVPKDFKCPEGEANCLNPQQQYEKLLPDLDVYIEYIWLNVVPRVGGAAPRTKDDAVAVLFNYGCRQISRNMPGYARIVEVRIPPPAPGLTGNWDDRLDGDARKDALGQSTGKSKDPKGDPNKFEGPPPKEEVVEVCNITHAQLEATLKKDIAILSGPRIGRRVTAPSREKVAGVDAPLDTIRNLEGHVSLAEGPGQTDLNMQKACAPYGGKPSFEQGSGFGAKRARVMCNGTKLNLDEECKKQYGGPGVKASSAGINWTRPAVECRVESPNAPKNADELLLTDLGTLVKDQPHLQGQTFGVIAGRLIGFYRKGGKAKTFEIAKNDLSNKVSIPEVAGASACKGPKDSSPNCDVAHQNKYAAKNTDREYLRRRVDQWTDAWEYIQLTNYVVKDPAVAKSGAPAEYRRAESVAFKGFWRDCTELWDLCQDPKLDVEREACIKCAYKAVLDHCIDAKRANPVSCKEAPPLINVVPLRAGSPPKVADPRFVYGVGDVIERLKGNRTTISDPNVDGGKPFTIEHTVGNTFFNWLVLQFLVDLSDTDIRAGHPTKAESFVRLSVVRSIAARKFLPFGSSSSEHFFNSEGKRFVEQLPISAWQKCYLWKNPGWGGCDIIGATKPADRKALESAVQNWTITNRDRSPLFQLILADDQVKKMISEVNQLWIDVCASSNTPVRVQGKRINNCTIAETNAAKTWTARLQVGTNQLADQMGFKTESDMSSTGGGIANAIMPIVGKILGMLMKAAGIEDMMKTLAKAAGMTPEQSADCDDAEYRHEVMKLTEKKVDNKQTCLTKVFAKNFVNVLESIIIMLGNKLVDWAVDLLNTALKGVKLALISAAGSVPFVGGVLASAVDIAWDLLFQFGVKYLLKSLVVAQLPKWMKVRELAKYDLFELIKNHPIISIVAGIILQLIEAAVTYGDKGLLEVGFQTVLGTIQAALEAKCKQGCDFWIRALAFAKKDLLAKSKKDMSVDEQIRQFLSSMIEGFKATIAGRLSGNAKDDFEEAVREVQDFVMTISWNQVVAKLTADPVGFIVGDLLAKKLLPAVVPLITAFVEMPEVAKKVLNELAGGISWAVRKLRKGGSGISTSDVVKRIAALFREMGAGLIVQIPAVDSVKTLLGDAYGAFVWAIENLQQFKTQYLDRPWEVVKKLLGWLRGFVVTQVGEYVADTRLGLEKTFVGDAVGRLFDLLANDSTRAQILEGAQGVDVKGVFVKAIDIAKPYVAGRLAEAAKGTGLEGVLGRAVDALFSADGPFAKGDAFVSGAAMWLEEKGPAVLGEIAEGAASLLGQGAAEAGQGPALVALAKGVVGTMRDALRAPGGLSGLARKGAAEIVRLAKEAMKPLALAVERAISGGNPNAPIAGHVRAVIGGLIDLFDNPAQLVQQGQAAWKAFTGRVGTNVREIVRAMVERVLPANDVQQVVAKVSLDEKSIASVVVQLVERAVGGSPIMPIVKEVIESAVRVAANPSQLQATLQGGAAAAFKKLQATALAMLQQLVASVIRDGTLAKVADEAVKTLAGVFERGIGAAAAQVGALAKEALARVVPLVFAFIKEKVMTLFPPSLAVLQGFVRDGFDWLARFAVDAFTKPDAWSRLTGGGGGTLKGIVDGVLGVVKAQLARATSLPVVNSFLGGLVDAAGGFLKNAAEVVKAFRDKSGSTRKLVEQIGPVVIGFLKSLFVDRLSGIAKTVVKFLVDRVGEVLANSNALLAFVDSATKSSPEDNKKLVKGVVVGLLKQLVGFVKDKSRTIADIVSAAVTYVENGQDVFSR